MIPLSVLMFSQHPFECFRSASGPCLLKKLGSFAQTSLVPFVSDRSKLRRLCE